MTETKQKEREKRLFCMFRKNYQLPEGVIRHQDRPDVIINGKRKIGIEITEFYLKDGSLPESEQVQNKARKAVILKAQDIYLGNGGKGIGLSFTFNKPASIRNQNELSNRIASLATSIEEEKTGLINKSLFGSVPELSYVYLNSGEYENQRWKVCQDHQVESMAIDKLQKIVNGKEKLVDGYEPCDAYWLLVVVDFTDAAQDQEIQIGEVRIESTVFEKVFVYKTHFGHVVMV